MDGRADAFSVQRVDPLFQLDPKPVGWLYDVFPDGQRFLMVKPPADQDVAAKIVVVPDWEEKLKRQVPTR